VKYPHSGLSDYSENLSNSASESPISEPTGKIHFPYYLFPAYSGNKIRKELPASGGKFLHHRNSSLFRIL